MAKRGLPSGAVTFLFTDIEGSTRLWERFPDAMRRALAEHDRILRDAIDGNEGRVFSTGGDAFCAAFNRPQDAVLASIAAQRELASTAWPPEISRIAVRMGVHSGTAIERGGDYFGPTLNRVARLMAIGHGGQVLVSSATETLLRESAGGGFSLCDLGAHRLKDLGRSESAFQVLAEGLRDEFPALCSLDLHAHNLPLQLSTFVGRERELADLRELVEQHRLVTIAGPGGIGKTRVSLQLAADVISRFEDGAWFVDLSGIVDASLVASCIAVVLDLLVDGQESLGMLVRHLSSKHALVVVDNSEHVLSGASATIKTILSNCPRVSIVTTSREPLHLAGEYVYRLPSLACAPENVGVRDLLAFQGPRLFWERAHAVAHDLSLDEADATAVAVICRKLEGIPLAIELAAARVGSLTVQQINRRLAERLGFLVSRDSTDERHRTLEATVQWSYRLLNDDEQRAFLALAVFASGFTLEAFEAVLPVVEAHPMDLITSLVEKSFVLSERTGRYRLLDPIRSFSREHLKDAGGLARACRRHAEYFESLARQAGDGWSALSAEALAALGPEIDNLRAALEWALVGDGDVGLGLKLAVASHGFFSELLPGEGVLWLQRALARIPDSAPPSIEAYLQCKRSMLRESPDWVLRSSGERAIELYREVGDAQGLAEALLATAQVVGWYFREDRELADRFACESIEIARKLGDARQLGAALRTRGLTIDIADLPGKRAVLEESLALARATANEPSICAALNWISEFEFSAGNGRLAMEYGTKALEVAERAGSKKSICNCTSNLAHYAAAGGDLERAISLARTVIGVSRETSQSALTTYGIGVLAAVEAARGGYALAARLVGFCDARFGTLHAGRQADQCEDLTHRRLMTLLRERLDHVELAELLDDGARLTEEEAIEAALKTPSGRRKLLARDA